MARRTTRTSRVRKDVLLTFRSGNYARMGAAVSLIVLGYILMLIDNAVSANPVDGVLSLYFAPVLLFLGYAGVAWAIIWAPKDAPTVEERV
ncbi:hypothetical protein BH23BAC4_BH23BAC4_04570 [soil metagenome]